MPTFNLTTCFDRLWDSMEENPFLLMNNTSGKNLLLPDSADQGVDDNQDEGGSDGKQMIDDRTRDICELVISFVTLFVSLLGVATNSINLRVFVKQGVMSDSTTIGFFALSVADFLACTISLPQSVCFYFKMADRPVTFLNCHAATLMPSQYPRILFSRISCWVNVYIAVERCLCVLMPLKVKLLIQPKMTSSVMVSIYIFFGLFHLPLAVNTYLAWRFNDKLNQSVMVVAETPTGKTALYYQSLIGTTILSSTAIVIVAITTVLLLYKLNRSRAWSKSVSTSGMTAPSSSATGSDGNSGSKKQPRKRDLEVMKTVSAVTSLFLVCLTMSHLPALASLAIPGFFISGKNSNMLYLLYNFKFLFDTINSASNFFFYIRISTRYKTAFNAVFRGQDEKK